MVGLMVSASVAECESEPLEPVAVTVKLPVAALRLAPSMIGMLPPTEPAKGLDGLEATPLGNPVKETCTAPLKPFCGLTVRETAEVDIPCDSASELTDSWSEKSGGETEA